MAIFTPNFEEAPQLAPGTYRARIVSCEQKQSKQGSPYLNWKFETVDARYPGKWVYLMTGLSGKGAQKLKKLIQVAFDPNYESGSFDTDHLINCELMIKVDQGINADGSPSKYMEILDVFKAEASDFDAF